MKLSRPVLFCCGVLTFAPGISTAAILSQWNFNSNTYDASNVASNFVAGSVTAGTFTGGTGVALTANTSSVKAVGDTGYVLTFGAANLDTSEASALSRGNVFTITVGPSAGNAMSLTSLSFYGWGNTAGSGPDLDAIYHYFIRSSVTGTTTLIDFTLRRINNTTLPGASDFYTLDLSGLSEFSNVTEPVTFTIGAYASQKVNSGNFRLDSVQIDGTISPIPELSAALISVLGVGGMLVRRRRSGD